MRTILLLTCVVTGCVDDSNDWVGDACRPSTVPAGGFDDHETFYESGADECAEGGCLVNHYQGDLDPDPRLGDEYADCEAAVGEQGGFQCIEDRVYCSCKCGVSAGGDPDSVTCNTCPTGFECCPTFHFGPEAGDYCVHEGTCWQAE